MNREIPNRLEINSDTITEEESPNQIKTIENNQFEMKDFELSLDLEIMTPDKN